MKFPLKLIWFHFNRPTQTFKVSNLKRAKNFEQKKFPKAQSQKLFSTRRLPSRIEKNLFLSGKLLPDLRRTSLYAPQCIQINKFLWKVSRKKFLALLKVGGGAYSKKFLQKCKFNTRKTENRIYLERPACINWCMQLWMHIAFERHWIFESSIHQSLPLLMPYQEWPISGHWVSPSTDQEAKKNKKKFLIGFLAVSSWKHPHNITQTHSQLKTINLAPNMQKIEKSLSS